MRARIAVVAVATILVSSVPIAAFAHHHDPSDANDTHGLLDIHHVDSLGRPRPHFRPRFRIRTFARWTRKGVEDTGFFVVAIDTFGSKRLDYYALVRSSFRPKGRPRIQASLWRDRHASKRDRRVAALHVRRINRRTVTVRIPFSKVRHFKRHRYRWLVKSLFTSRRCKKVCVDRVPNEGVFTEPNGFR